MNINKSSIFIKDISYIFLSEVFIFIASLILGILTARTLGVAGKGELGVITGAAGLVSLVLSLRFPSAITYFSSRQRRASSINNIIIAGCIVGVLILVFFSVIELFFPKIVSDYLLKGIKDIPLFLFFFLLLTSYLYSFYTALLAGMQHFLQRTIFISTVYVLRIITTVFCLVIVNVNVKIYISIMVGIEFIYYLFVLIYTWNKNGIVFRINIYEFIEMLKYSIAGYLGLLSDLIIIRIDVFIVNYFKSTSEAGLYIVAVSLANMLLYIPTAIKTGLLPYIASSDKDNGEKTAQIIRLLMIFFFIGVFIFIFMVKIFLRPLYGEEFGASFSPFILLIPGSICFGYYSIIASDIAGRGYPWINSRNAFIVALLTIALDLWLVPIWGAKGAAIASSITYTIALIITTYSFISITKIDLKNLFLPQKKDLSLILGLLHCSTTK